MPGEGNGNEPGEGNGNELSSIPGLGFRKEDHPGLCNDAALMVTFGRFLRFGVEFAALSTVALVELVAFFFLPAHDFPGLAGPGVNPLSANLKMCNQSDARAGETASESCLECASEDHRPTLARRGIPPVLDHILCSARKKLRDFAPSEHINTWHHATNCRK